MNAPVLADAAAVWIEAPDSLGDPEIEAQMLDEHEMGESIAEIVPELIREGVPVGDIWRRVESGSLDPPRLDRVVYTGHGFEFARHVDQRPETGAVIFLVRNRFGHPIDLAAWSPPRSPVLWHARACMLGEESIFAPRMSPGLVVHETVLGWMRAACRGVVPIDWPKAADLLRRAAPLMANSREHGHELRERLSVRPPHILVPAAA
jgi:hypothetical protein